MIHVVHLRTSFDERPNRSIRSFDGFWELIHILRLDDGFEIIFKDFRKVVCKKSVSIASTVFY
jgi:hypothetical protein